MYSYKFLLLASLAVIPLANFNATESLYQPAVLFTPLFTQVTEPASPIPGCDRTDPPDCQSRQPQSGLFVRLPVFFKV